MSELNEFQRWCKEILPIVQAAADGEEIEYLNFANKWINRGSQMATTFNPELKYRVKPRAIKVNGFDVPEAITKEPELGSSIFIANVSAMDFYQVSEWHDTYQQNRELQRGLVHTAKEAAIAHAKAMLGIDPNGGDE